MTKRHTVVLFRSATWPRPRRAPTPCRQFHGQVRGRRPPAPFLPPRAPQPPPRRRAPRLFAGSACGEQRPDRRELRDFTSGGTRPLPPCRHDLIWRTLRTAVWRQVRRGASLVTVNTSSSTARGRVSPPPATARGPLGRSRLQATTPCLSPPHDLLCGNVPRDYPRDLCP